jgi:hypothetical protein
MTLYNVSHAPRIVGHKLCTYAYIKASTSIQVQHLVSIFFMVSEHSEILFSLSYLLLFVDDIILAVNSDDFLITLSQAYVKNLP